MIEEETEAKTAERSRAITWFVRLALLTAVVLMCSVAAYLIADRWLSTSLGENIGSQAVNSNLNVIERIYLGLTLASRDQDLKLPVGRGTESVRFTVSSGESAEAIAANLEETGLLGDPELFLNYLRYYGLDSILEAGTYRLDPQLTYPELARRLTKAAIEEVELNFLPGWRLEEMVDYLDAVRPAKIDPEEFQTIVSIRDLVNIEEYPFLQSVPTDATLEGFLFPDSYTVSVNASAADLVALMLDNFDQNLTPAMRQSIGAQGLTIYEAVILASIIQREAIVDNEKSAIASVFFNRLRNGMPLQADPTVQYALGYEPETESWWKSPLTGSDLEIDSPYNTYVIDGLPIGPISNPGLLSLQAVAAPLTTDYLYFVSDCSADGEGLHIFSTTFDEHLTHVEGCR